MESRIEALKPFEEQKELMEERIATGIEANRKGDLKLSITDAAGIPVSDVHVKLKQTDHDFLHGANIFMLDEFETEQKNTLYRERFGELFNQATLPFYWKDLEPVRGKPRYAKTSERIYRRPAPDLCLEYCEQNGITPKAHCLFYEPFTPDWVPTDDIPRIKEAVSAHFAELAARYGDRIHGWEVINETLTRYHGVAKNRFYDEPDLIEWCFAEATKYFPENELIINEAHPFIWEFYSGDRSAYSLLIERALAKGARIDTVGLQYHMFHALDRYVELSKIYYSPKRIFEVMDCYARFGKPLQITEVTLSAFSDSAEDEAMQSEILRNVYRMWFSHEAVEAITYWNLVDGYAAFAKQGDMTKGENIYYGGLLRFDFTPKPAYFALKDLFQKEYHTECSGKTHADGNYGFRGFYGSYEVELEKNGRKTKTAVAFKKDQNKHITIQL